jgi:glutamate--cysteine ligase catalytic subunit
MERAQKRGSSRNTKFWFRRSIYPPGEERTRSPLNEVDLPTPPSERVDSDDLAIRPNHKGDCGKCSTHSAFLTKNATDKLVPVEEEYEEMTIDEIINGKVIFMSILVIFPCTNLAINVQGSKFPGLLGAVNEYVKTLDVEYAKKKALRKYLNLVKHRADGRLRPIYSWYRHLISNRHSANGRDMDAPVCRQTSRLQTRLGDY